MKKFVIFIMFFLLVALYEVSSRERVKEHKDYNPSRISISGQSITESINGNNPEFIKNKKDGSFERHIEKSNEALTYQKSLIRPYIDMFLENPVKCEVIKNNEQALVEYKKILTREDCPNIEKELGLDLGRKQKISHIINLELEKDIQDITKGRICLRYPNPTTFEALVEIWKKYPCSEAAIDSLGQMKSAMQTTHITHVDIQKKATLAYRNEMIDISEYIIDNYPDSYQVKVANESLAIRKYGYNSKQSMEAHEELIDYMDKNKKYINSMYDRMYGVNGMEQMVWTYSHLARIYNERFKDITKGNNSVKYNIPSEAIEIYEKHYRLLIRLQKKYPDLRQPSVPR